MKAQRWYTMMRSDDKSSCICYVMLKRAVSCVFCLIVRELSWTLQANSQRRPHHPLRPFRSKPDSLICSDRLRRPVLRVSSLITSELTVNFNPSGKKTAPPPSPTAAFSIKAGLEEEQAAVTVKPGINTEAPETAADANASLPLRLAAVLQQAVTEEQRQDVAGHMIT